MSAAISPYLKRWRIYEIFAFAYELTDETFALHSNRFYSGAEGKLETLSVNITAHLSWVTGTWIGIVAGQMITDVKPLGLDYALVAMFIALLLLQLKDSKGAVIAILSGMLSTAFTISGINQWNVIGATLIGATCGVLLDQWTRIKYF